MQDGFAAKLSLFFSSGMDPDDGVPDRVARRIWALAIPLMIELARSTDDEKQSQLTRLEDFHQRHAAESPAMLKRLQQAVIDDKNVFEVLMQAVRCCSQGRITHALFEVGGPYRRSM